jgi:hypothetical protein
MLNDMHWYEVQVYHNSMVEYKRVIATSYEQARDIVLAQLVLGRIIAITKRESVHPEDGNHKNQ